MSNKNQGTLVDNFKNLTIEPNNFQNKNLFGSNEYEDETNTQNFQDNAEDFSQNKNFFENLEDDQRIDDTKNNILQRCGLCLGACSPAY